MPDLKLLALDADDLEVLAAHLQDAVLRVGEMAFQKREARFAFVANRFDWAEAAASKKGQFARRRAGVRFERVRSVKVTGFDPAQADATLSLLTLGFEPTEAPSGHITLHFSGGGAVRLDVECVEAALEDLGAAWGTRNRPTHPEG